MGIRFMNNNRSKSHVECTENIFIQEIEPEIKEGIWIKAPSLIYDNIVFINSLNDKVANSINICDGTKYSTILLNSSIVNGLPSKFKMVYITDEDNNIREDLYTYYGNGEYWIDITYVPIKWAGVTVDYANNSISSIDGSSDVNDLKCYQRTRVNLADDGTILARYGDDNYDNIGSSSSQVMVEQPQLYYKLDNITLASDGVSIEKADYLVADGEMDGFELHPAFKVGDKVMSNIYIGAFEATLLDDKLASVGDGTNTPLVYKTRAEFRNAALNRGSNWRQLTIQVHELEKLMQLIEYKSFDLQSELSAGVTNSAYMVNVGMSYSLDDNGTGKQGETISTSAPFTWRWRENPYGNTYKFVDGINIYGETWYISDDNLADDTYLNYTKITNSASDSSGYISRFAYNENAKWLFMPKQVSSSTTLIPDEYYVNGSSTWHISRVSYAYGGNKNAGSFCLDNSQTSNLSASDNSSILVYLPIN